jgi:hypothetical protein
VIKLAGAGQVAIILVKIILWRLDRINGHDCTMCHTHIHENFFERHKKKQGIKVMIETLVIAFNFAITSTSAATISAGTIALLRKCGMCTIVCRCYIASATHESMVWDLWSHKTTSTRDP